MGRCIRGPGTGDPRDSWKEKREVDGAWRDEGGRWRGVPQPGPLPSRGVSRASSRVTTLRPGGAGQWRTRLRLLGPAAAPSVPAAAERVPPGLGSGLRPRAADCEEMHAESEPEGLGDRVCKGARGPPAADPTWQSSGWRCGWPPAPGSGSAGCVPPPPGLPGAPAGSPPPLPLTPLLQGQWPVDLPLQPVRGDPV